MTTNFLFRKGNVQYDIRGSVKIIHKISKCRNVSKDRIK